MFRYRRYDVNGIAQRISEQFSDVIECPTKAHAERKIADRRNQINAERACVFFSDLADKYEAEDLPTLRPHTQRSNLGNLRILRARWDDVRLDRMVSDLMGIQLWINNLKGPKGNDYSRGTRQHVRNLLHKIFEDAMLWGLISLQRNPISLIEVKAGARKKARKLILTPKQIAALVADERLPLHVKMMIRIAACTGMRISEILGLQWTDVNFESGVIAIVRSADCQHIGMTKTADSETESYPMHPLLSEALQAWKRHPEYIPINGWVFGSALTGRPFHASSLRDEHLKPAGERAGITGLGWHTFRHTYRAMLADLEVPLEVQQALMRHSDISMTIEYGKFSSQRSVRMRQVNAKVVSLVSGL